MNSASSLLWSAPDKAQTLSTIRSSYSKDIMQELKGEISGQGTFEGFSREIEKIGIQKPVKSVDGKETEKLRSVAEGLRGTIDEEKIACEKQRNRVLEELAEKERKAEQRKLVADAEARYIAAWERARCEQIRLRSGMEIRELRKTLEECRIREENKSRVHEEVTNFLMQRIASIEERIVEWEQRYERERKAYEKDIWSLEVEIDERQRSLSELRNEHRRNQEFIDAYQAEQEARRKRRALEEHMRRSAIRIQAWWRGVMVRRKLGPYRPEEKKKKRTAKTKK